ncbi:MAG: thiamine phosphate synthase [Gammaproteobacteria bacterium]|jgi:thiamine-phosphate pyrophosphorylase
MRTGLRGLYVITDATLQPPDALTDRVIRAIEGGAALVQYRDKSTDHDLRLRQARELAAACRARGALLIINDDIGLAAESGAHGVHLGRDDPGPEEARRRLGTEAVVGASCYDQWSRACDAAAKGVDYIAFGRFFRSRTKPGAAQASLDLIRRARQQWAIPVAAIGGITPQNGGQLVEAGADMLAVVQGVFAAPDCRQATAAYAALFEGGEPREALTNPSSRGVRGRSR